MTYRPPSASERLSGLISVPRPAMFVEIVTAPNRPAAATSSASRSSLRALSTSHGTPAVASREARSSDSFTEPVPTSTGRPVACAEAISETSASTFSVRVLKTRSGRSTRRTGSTVGTTTVESP